MREDFAALGVEFVAISPDTPEEVARFVARESLSVRVLSDADLQVTSRYNLRSQKTLAFGTGRSMVRELAIPTTILVDAQGIVRWIDQADDFRVRSDAPRVLRCVRGLLTGVGAAPVDATSGPALSSGLVATSCR